MMSNQFVESLRRLYKKDKISEKRLKELLDSKKIKENEYQYILSVKEEV